METRMKKLKINPLSSFCSFVGFVQVTVSFPLHFNPNRKKNCRMNQHFFSLPTRIFHSSSIFVLFVARLLFFCNEMFHRCNSSRSLALIPSSFGPGVFSSAATFFWFDVGCCGFYYAAVIWIMDWATLSSTAAAAAAVPFLIGCDPTLPKLRFYEACR